MVALKVISPGKFLEGIQLQMTKTELGEWVNHFQFPLTELFKKNGNHSIMHCYLLQGQLITVYETEEKQDA